MNKVKAEVNSTVEENEKWEAQAKSLPEGWVWENWYDGSGKLYAPGKTASYFLYDRATNEFVHPATDKWFFWDGYIYVETFEEFQRFAEAWIIENILHVKG